MILILKQSPARHADDSRADPFARKLFVSLNAQPHLAASRKQENVRLEFVGKFDGFTREDLMTLADTASLSKSIAAQIVEQVGNAVSRWEQFSAQAGAPQDYVEQIKTNQRLYLARRAKH